MICNGMLWIGKFNDGLYHFIGAIYELELAQLGWKGFNTYQEAVDTRNKYRYKEFKI